MLAFKTPLLIPPRLGVAVSCLILVNVEDDPVAAAAIVDGVEAEEFSGVGLDLSPELVASSVDDAVVVFSGIPCTISWLSVFGIESSALNTKQEE